MKINIPFQLLNGICILIAEKFFLSVRLKADNGNIVRQTIHSHVSFDSHAIY